VLKHNLGQERENAGGKVEEKTPEVVVFAARIFENENVDIPCYRHGPDLKGVNYRENIFCQQV